jgi:hypothetical protein
VSKTELEEDLRSTFERAAASVPYAPDLVSRSKTGVRRQRRTWAAAGAAAVGVAAVAAVGVMLQGGPEVVPRTVPQPAATPAATPATTPAASASASVPTITLMSGTWEPLRMAGFTGLKRARPELPVLVFAADGVWTGSDGCNSLSGTFTTGPKGQFSATINGQRLAGCDNVPHTGVLAGAKKVTASQASLRFFAANGQELALYVRSR